MLQFDMAADRVRQWARVLALLEELVVLLSDMAAVHVRRWARVPAGGVGGGGHTGVLPSGGPAGDAAGRGPSLLGATCCSRGHIFADDPSGWRHLFDLHNVLSC